MFNVGGDGRYVFLHVHKEIDQALARMAIIVAILICICGISCGMEEGGRCCSLLLTACGRGADSMASEGADRPCSDCKKLVQGARSGANMRGMPLPPPKGKKEVARVLINNADNGGQMPLIIYHDLTDARGVESDVDRFISQYQIDPEMYRDKLLQAAHNALEQPSATGGARRASSSGGGFQHPLGKTERMQEGSRFGDTFDEEEDEEDEEDEEEGDADAHDGEEEEEEEDSPKQSRRAGGTSVPRQGKSAASLPGSSGNDDDWADEDEEHDHLPPPSPPPPPPPATKSVRDRGAKLGELKLRIPQSDSGDMKEVTFPYFERDDYGMLLAEAKTFVSKHAMAEKEVDRIVDAAAKRLQKKKQRLQRQ